jgi:hypothetical protein
VVILEARGLKWMSARKCCATILIGYVIAVESQVEGHIHVVFPLRLVFSSRNLVSIRVLYLLEDESIAT